ncbi:aspartic and glutamic acid-rich protein-like [Stegodyphus dumicola]|uniref:aspartic and glutamic acid-rich protein-like n=1 Tax=Stegodyphus dumicola TaxID=202533 RepID=UPI0015B0EEA4|nr:aspartic and glutamic acid-rich protein-like [Stegodyphus dumicola]XP_035218549.1 aspartic and glutamic acid-rich protein-like [Stegodyphus dumicola]
MFSSLAKYIFGGLIGNSNEPVECETQEVNDWLLVNLPDQVGKDLNIDIDYEEENEKEEEIDNTELNVHTEKEEEIDNAEHHHIPSEKEEKIDNTEHYYVHSEKEEEMDNTEHYNVHSQNEEEIDNTEHHYVHSEEDEENSEEDEESSEEDEESSQEDEESSEEDKESCEEDEDENQEVVPAQKKESICDYDKSYCELQIPYEVKLSFNLQATEQVINESFLSLQKIDSVAMRDLFVYESKLTSVRILFNLRLNQLTVNVRAPKRLRNPASHIKNHTSQSAISPKAELLERIKDLKPAQRAIEYEKKKYISRSQLNRQNRNYIFQASSKTNRRKNLQRHHSGANNNRRC